MNKKLRTVNIAMLGWVGLMTISSTHAAIIETDYFSLSGNVLIDFEGVAGGNAPGTNYDGIVDLNGASFGESFSGQTLGVDGDSDTLDGAPTGGGLTLLAGEAGQNINIIESGSNGNVISGLGPTGFPNYNAIGEGAFSILFDNDQSEFGFQSIGGNLGFATFAFWGRDGTLLGSINPMGLGAGFFGFMSDTQNIAGISIWNTDPFGIGFDNIVFDVPAVPVPGALVLFGSGIAGMLGWKKLSRT